ncbi:DNA-binding FadR family transcriptional regulator [Rhodoligotrophos appendicifer]|uniref:FadR/GntR family transcriptional regulator n=1 Tax=Rhodoligotrophos appendicifer TaxID=987056 RepID=UPI0011865F89|nr:FadR/GntR family transcriptional regulator [Rhodoligotrophos appendicifer]
MERQGIGLARKASESKVAVKSEWQAQSPSRPSRLADQLYGQILDRIVSGAMPEGEKLPSESQLCELFGVSRPVVREALSRLQADHLVISRHGSGTFVQRRPNQAFALLTPIEDVADLMRCMEFRIGLEGEAAYLAASRRSEADLERMKRAFDGLEQVIASGDVGSEADREFHVAIAAAAQNRLFVQTMEVLADHTLRGMELARKLSLRQSARRLQLVQQEHIRILNAIEMEEPDEAREAMRSHIDNARLRVLTDSTEP